MFAWFSRTRNAGTSGWAPALKAGVRAAFEKAWDEGMLFGENVVKGAFRKFRSGTKTSITLVEVARACVVFVVKGKGAVIIATGTVSTTRTWTRFDLVAGFHFAQGALKALRIFDSQWTIDEKAISRPAQQDHFLLTFRQLLE